MEMLSYEEWLRQSGWIQKGDCLYVVSDMLELAKTVREQGRRLDRNSVIDTLQELVGESGTLLFPTFNWDFCKGIGFDYYRTPVKTGALPKAALGRPDFSRTAHPLYSFAVWGDRKEELMGIDAIDAFGKGTIFERLYDWDARVLVIGLEPLEGVTYIHHVEQMVGVPYRYNKEFTADYTDAAGRTEQRTYRMYVRDLQLNPQHINGFEPLAKKMMTEGMIMSREYGSVENHFLRIRDLEQAVREDIVNNDSQNMYRYGITDRRQEKA